MIDRTTVGPNLRPTHMKERWIQDVIRAPRANAINRPQTKVNPRYQDVSGKVVPIHVTKETFEEPTIAQLATKLSGFDSLSANVPQIKITHPQPHTKPAIERTQASNVLK